MSRSIHFCEICEKRLKEIVKVSIGVEKEATAGGAKYKEPIAEYELCYECARKLRDTLDEGKICQQ